ncbi:hypothetical protein DET54_102143 [Paenibacillus pabuli]|uniref:Uncharacterized protein n=1 Tax=Paenibacillus pabuli TaxID=1472 RepID=A0A855XQ52_9BACL|nr:hypothetical protein DET56_110156 [Paenibacillus pabuli]PXW04176.1 hypothetical protein DEU73_109142 [Paenibacillus taichungensis]RAJ00656.1 hypothetical protein DET54_102143 [Paenibacillus pabuli]
MFFCPLSVKLINTIKSSKLTLTIGYGRFKRVEINMIILVGIKIDVMREVANGGTSSDKQPF